MKKCLALCLMLCLLTAALTGCSREWLESLMNSAGKQVAQTPPTPATTNMPAPTGLPVEGGAPYEAEEAYLMADGAAYESGYYEDDFNTEEYAAVKENGFQSVATSPLSTFSADVDTASYGNLRRMIYDGYTLEEIPDGAVRIEEMLNYFRYGYDVPQGDEKFAVTPLIAPCPWAPEHRLLLLGVRSQVAQATEEGSNLVFLVDVSGSMDDADKIGLLKEALTMLVDELGENDTISIVTYASEERIIIEGASPVKDRLALLNAIDSLYASGSTAGEKGLRQAYDTAEHYFRRNGNNRIILCSDGDLNVGMTSQSELEAFVSEKRETGIYLSVLGFGRGNYKDTKMETIADAGNGNYYYIDSKLEAQKVLCEELTQTLFTVADDVKFQIEFNPTYVAAYRQIGYENRQLDDADFDDDAKDAGEVGSGAMVTVLYELIPAGAEDAPQSDLRYQQNTPTEQAAGDEWLTVAVRYKEPGAQESVLREFTAGQADIAEDVQGDLAFASAVAEFGMILRSSEYAKDLGYDDVLELLKKAELDDPYKEEFFSLVKLIERNDRLG